MRTFCHFQVLLRPVGVTDGSEPNSTNLGVRGSNPFGRATPPDEIRNCPAARDVAELFHRRLSTPFMAPIGHTPVTHSKGCTASGNCRPKRLSPMTVARANMARRRG